MKLWEKRLWLCLFLAALSSLGASSILAQCPETIRVEVPQTECNIQPILDAIAAIKLECNCPSPAETESSPTIEVVPVNADPEEPTPHIIAESDAETQFLDGWAHYATPGAGTDSYDLGYMLYRPDKWWGGVILLASYVDAQQNCKKYWCYGHPTHDKEWEGRLLIPIRLGGR